MHSYMYIMRASSPSSCFILMDVMNIAASGGSHSGIRPSGLEAYMQFIYSKRGMQLLSLSD